MTRGRAHHPLLPYLICTLASFFYLYEFSLRVTPAAITTELMHDFRINAEGLGMLSAFFFYAYAPMQIPAGLLLDRFGPRLLMSIAIGFCGLGALIFGMTDLFWLASLSRMMIGFGASFAFVGALVLISEWFDAKYFAMLIGCVQMLGAVGAIAGEAPIRILVDDIGWRSTMIWIADIGLIAALIFWLVIRDRPRSSKSTTEKKESTPPMRTWPALKLIARNPQNWIVGICSIACWAPVSVFASLWGIPFMVKLLHISTEYSAEIMALMWIGIAVGGPCLGWLSNTIQKRRPILIGGLILGAIAALILFYLPHPSLFWVYTCLTAFGVSASSQCITFGVIQDNNPPEITGAAMGYNNMALLVGGVTLQPLVGLVLCLECNTGIGKGVYSLLAYRHAFITLPLTAIIGIIVCGFFLKETHCQPQFT